MPPNIALKLVIIRELQCNFSKYGVDGVQGFLLYSTHRTSYALISFKCPLWPVVMSHWYCHDQTQRKPIKININFNVNQNRRQIWLKTTYMKQRNNLNVMAVTSRHLRSSSAFFDQCGWVIITRQGKRRKNKIIPWTING